MWNTLREAVVITAYAVISDEILELMKKTADDTNEQQGIQNIKKKSLEINASQKKMYCLKDAC